MITQIDSRTALVLIDFQKGIVKKGTAHSAEDIHITKRGWNAFFQTPLHDELQKREITQIVLCGISTSIGVEGTARAASELGYNIIFVTDAMTDTVLASHNNSLLNIFPRLGELGSAYDVINLLNLRD